MNEPPSDRPQKKLYGRRRGKRLRAGRQRLFEALMPTLAIPPERLQAPLDPACLFARPVREVWLEIGFGGGEHLAWQAGRNPDVGVIGCEPYVSGAARLFTEIEAQRLDNVRVLLDDARLLLHALNPDSIARVFLLFPDPWPKLRHHKRRFVNDENIRRMARLMKTGGEWRMATDDMGYCRWMLAQLARHDSFAWTARRPGDWRERPPDLPETRYERKARAAGRPCVYLSFRRSRQPAAEGDA